MLGRKWLKVSLLAVLLSVAVLLPLPVLAQEKTYVFVHLMARKLYTPTQFIVTYEHSNDYSGNVIPGRTGRSTLTMTQTKATFDTDDVDDFNVTLTIKYSMPVEQTVSYIFVSADERVAGDEIPVYAQTLIFRLMITTTSKPSYPTSAEVMNETIPALNEMSIKLDRYMEYFLVSIILQFAVLVAVIVDLYLRRGPR